MFSDRTNWKIKPNRLALALESLKKQGKDFLDLTESNPTLCGFECYNQFPFTALANPENRQYHPSPQGLGKAREAIVRYYKEKDTIISPEQIFLTAGTSEAYAFLFRLLANAGETLLAPAPGYPLFDFLADLNDVQLAFYPLLYDRGWHLVLENINRLACPKPKALIVVHPNNPTGSFLKQSELRGLNQWAAGANAALISDEVFLDYDFENAPERAGTLAANSDCLTFTLGGISKSLGLPQMKVGWMIINGPAQLMQNAIERLEVIADTYLSVNTPVQNALPEWLAFGGKIRREIMARLLENKKFLTAQIKRAPACELLRQEGGWYAIIKIPRMQNEEEWALELLQKDKVYVHPGFFFNFEEEAYLIISLLPAASIFQEGIKKILARLAAA